MHFPKSITRHILDPFLRTLVLGKIHTVDGPDWRSSWMAVIYDQQGREGQIVDERDERDVKQGRARPHKQHLVRCRNSWVDGARLTAPEFLQS